MPPDAIAIAIHTLVEHVHTATKATAATSAQRELVLGASPARTIVPNKDEFLRHMLLALSNPQVLDSCYAHFVDTLERM